MRMTEIGITPDGQIGMNESESVTGAGLFMSLAVHYFDAAKKGSLWQVQVGS